MTHPRFNLSKAEKAKNELYPTPPEFTEALLDNWLLPRHVWEPAAGDGDMVRVLEARGHEVLATDITTGQDFFETEPPERQHAKPAHVATRRPRRYRSPEGEAMTNHLPECPVPSIMARQGTAASSSCICDRLRACEQRVCEDERTYAKQSSTAIMAYDEGRRDGYAAALRDAIAAANNQRFKWKARDWDDAIGVVVAAINSLGGERSGNPDTSPSAENPDNRGEL